MRKTILIALGLGSFAALALLAASGTPQAAQAPARPFRVAVATFSHETCTFCPDPTTVADWEFYGPPTRERVPRRGGIHQRLQADDRRPRRDRARRDHVPARLARRLVGKLADPGILREILRPDRRGPPQARPVRRRFPGPPRGHGRHRHPQARGGALPPRPGRRRQGADHGHPRPPRQRGPGACGRGRRRVHHQALSALRHRPPGRAGRPGHGPDDPGRRTSPSCPSASPRSSPRAFSRGREPPRRWRSWSGPASGKRNIPGLMSRSPTASPTPTSPTPGPWSWSSPTGTRPWPTGSPTT